MFLNYIAVINIQLCEYTKSHQIVQFKRVNFMVCELYFNKSVIKQFDQYRFIVPRTLCIFEYHYDNPGKILARCCCHSARIAISILCFDLEAYHLKLKSDLLIGELKQSTNIIDFLIC